MIRAFLLKHGDDPEAMRLLAKIGMARDVLDDAETLLEAVLVLAPDYRRGAARLRPGARSSGRSISRRATRSAGCWRREPKNLDDRSLAATIAAGLGEHEAAIALYREMLVDAPGVAGRNLWLGHALKTVGRLPEAIDAYLAAAAARPDFGDAYWSLANLKTYRFDDATLERMRSVRRRGLDGADRPLPLLLRARARRWRTGARSAPRGDTTSAAMR